MKLLALALVGVLSTCTTPNDAVEDPLPRPQQPAPNADPKPSGQKRLTLVFSVTTSVSHYRDIEHWFEGSGQSLHPPIRRVYVPEYEFEETVNGPGIAKVSATSDPATGKDWIRCRISVKGGAVLMENYAFGHCDTGPVPISF